VTEADERPFLRRGGLNQMVSSGHQSIWGMQTLLTLAELHDPYFLGRNFSIAVVEGDQIMITCGPEDARVYGTLVVTKVKRADSGDVGLDGEVHVAVLNSTAPPRSRLKVVS
jgi:hypothetical protein